MQDRLSRYYGLEQAPPIDDFVRPADGGAREALVLRYDGRGLEIAVHLPRAVVEHDGAATLDQICQVVEGVSHFLYIADRARRELPATQLELELQAEVDKFVMLVDRDLGPPAFEHDLPATLVRARLYEGVTFAHPAGTESGDRYRMANGLAARFAHRLEARFAQHGRFDRMRATLRRFWGEGQTEKIALATAA